MNRILSLLLLSFLIASCDQGQKTMSKIEFDDPKRIMEKGSYGFINKNRDTLIPLGKYEFLNPMDEQGMILTKLNGKHGYINIHQDVIIPIKYEDLSVFTFGLAPAKLNGKYGYIKRTGDVVIPFQYDNESHFNKCGLAKAQLGSQYGFIDTLGVKVLPIEFEKVRGNRIDSFICGMKNQKWAFFNCEGKQLTEFEFDEITESFFSNRHHTYFKRGPCKVVVNRMATYINERFEEIVDLGKYETAEPFRNYLAIVGKNNKYGIIDSTGQVVVPIQYDFIEHPSKYMNKSDLFAIKQNEKYQFLDKTAKPITDFNIKEFKWDVIEKDDDFKRGFVLVNRADKVGFVTEDGQTPIEFIYDHVEPFGGDSITAVAKDGMYGLINSRGNKVLPFEYQQIYSSISGSDFIAQKSNKFGLLDKFGQTVINIKYENIFPVFYDYNNKFIVQKDGLYGIINRKGEVIIPLEYDTISNWVEYGPEEHFITKNGKEGLISKEGQIVIPPIYDFIYVNNSTLIKVKNNGLYGAVNWDNEIVHPIEYDDIQWEWPFLSGRRLDTIYLGQNGKYISTDIEGKVFEKNIDLAEIKKRIGY